MSPPVATAPRKGRTPIWVVLMVALALAIFVGANVHFLVVALESQPECVAHLKVGESDAGRFSAAKSSC